MREIRVRPFLNHGRALGALVVLAVAIAVGIAFGSLAGIAVAVVATTFLLIRLPGRSASGPPPSSPGL
jgi:hypothetical protein